MQVCQLRYCSFDQRPRALLQVTFHDPVRYGLQKELFIAAEGMYSGQVRHKAARKWVEMSGTLASRGVHRGLSVQTGVATGLALEVGRCRLYLDEAGATALASRAHPALHEHACATQRMR